MIRAPVIVNNRSVHDTFTRPVWAEISRSRLLHNYRALRALAGSDITVAAVIKGNAYGHGIHICAPWLAAEGAEWLGVTTVEEGVAVRALCPQPRIYVMASFWRGEAATLLAHRLTPSVWEPYHLEELAAAARRAHLAPQSVPVHLEIDTGMSRQGVAPGSALDQLLQLLKSFPELRLEAIMTHFFAPDELGSPATGDQIRRFATAADTIVAAGFRPSILHAGNSTTLLTGYGLQTLRDLAARRSARLMLRTGLALYGYAPAVTSSIPAQPEEHFIAAEKADLAFRPEPRSGEAEGPAVSSSSQQEAPHLLPVLSLKSRIISLRTIAPGDTAGYNATFRATRPTRLALLPIGYADGLSRLLSNRGHALVRGHRAPIAGRVSMDQTILDVTGIPAAIGDEAVLIGEQPSAEPNSPGEVTRITAADLATLCQTIPWEILTSIAARVHRVPVD